MFRFLIQKKTQGKYEVTRNLSSSVIENFNSYEMMRQNLARKERVDIIPVDIVYEPTYDENIIKAMLGVLKQEKREFVAVLLNSVITVKTFLQRPTSLGKNICSFAQQ